MSLWGPPVSSELHDLLTSRRQEMMRTVYRAGHVERAGGNPATTEGVEPIECTN
jgi:hypothetical protein